MKTAEHAKSGSYTVVLVGAGAVRGAWDPIVDAVRTVYKQVASADQAHTALANLVSTLRYWHYAQSRELDIEGTVRPSTKDTFIQYYNTLEAICSAIADALTRAEASQEYVLRDEFEAVWNLAIRSSATVKFVTTTWDRLIARRVCRQWPEPEDAVFHLHGDRRDATTLLLPMEAAFEPYRRPSVRGALQTRHAALRQVLLAAERLVIYGTSLSSDDAELIRAIAAGLDESPVRQVDIVDPRHDRAARRLMTLLQKCRPSLSGRTPDQLAPPTSYLWRPSLVG